MRQLRLATVLSLFCLAFASNINITIDDQNGDPTNGQKIIYDPPEAWVGNAIGGCDGCLLPNSSTVSASAGTFTGSLFTSKRIHSPPTAAVNFTGVFVSVVCILSNSLDDPPGESDMIFSIDGILADTFQYTPTGLGDFEPRSVFNSQPLSPGEHTLVISNGVVDGPNSLVILDSIIYSTDGLDLQSQALSPTSTSTGSPVINSSSSSIVPPSSSGAPVQVVVTKIPSNAVIAIIVCGVFLAVLFLLLAFLYIRRRRTRNQHRPLSTTLISPFIRGLWSESEYNLKPPPDIVVPLPTSIHPVPPAPTPRPRRLNPPVPSSGLLSPFNANLPDGQVRRRPPPPIPTQKPPGLRAAFASSRTVEISDPVSLLPHSGQPGLQDIAGQQRVVHQPEVSQVDHSDQSSISTPPPSYSS
ncbi:hypothetical protein GGX14DRAFT_653669 [Mycena pura]|uniref:Uncharacterized protein n=1 Tax=Mycena pura TaxID=153505 RepID=A0AAD6Y5I8_9AGAR|nr:hypothetical protein GGX14DRAFT_653669 [Mycena pura]